MCTGSSAAVRGVSAASAAHGSRFSVVGSMSANTGRARSYSTALAEATKENGLVITSSPSRTPAARSARCRPAVPLDTALASLAPTRAANARSNCMVHGPSDRRPERSTSTTARSSASPSAGRASGIASRAPAAEPDLDRGLRLDLAVRALLHEHPPGLQAKQRLVLAGLLAHQQLKGAVGGLELKAVVLQLLHALEHPLRERLSRASGELDTGA